MLSLYVVQDPVKNRVRSILRENAIRLDSLILPAKDTSSAMPFRLWVVMVVFAGANPVLRTKLICTLHGKRSYKLYVDTPSSTVHNRKFK